MKRQIATKSTQLAVVLALVTAFAGPAETCTRALGGKADSDQPLLTNLDL